MPRGPQRQNGGFPNLVVTPHGQTLGRKSDTAYTHAVVHTQPMDQYRNKLESTADFHRGLIEKYGEDADPKWGKFVGKIEKEIGSLPDSTHFSSVVSMHTGPEQARKRAVKEGNKGYGVGVLPVVQEHQVKESATPPEPKRKWQKGDPAPSGWKPGDTVRAPYPPGGF